MNSASRLHNHTTFCVQVMHGALLSTAELLLALHEAGYNLDGALQQRAIALAPSLGAAKLFRSRGGELLRAGACRCDDLCRLHTPCDITMGWSSLRGVSGRLKCWLLWHEMGLCRQHIQRLVTLDMVGLSSCQNCAE